MKLSLDKSKQETRNVDLSNNIAEHHLKPEHIISFPRLHHIYYLQYELLADLQTPSKLLWIITNHHLSLNKQHMDNNSDKQ